MNVVAINQNDDELPTGFEAFWILYPRHICKKDAARAWSRVPSELHVRVIVAVSAWRGIWLKRGEPEFIPHPATWLNGERWDDDLPSDGRQVSSSSHVAFGKSEPLPARGEIPEHVRAMMRKIMGK